MINKIIDKTEMASRMTAWISGFILLGVSVLITVEVVLRKVFSFSMGGADEISGYAMAVSCSWAFGYALFRKAHIRIDILYVKFPRWLRHALDILSLALFGFYMLILSYFAFHVFLISFVKSSTANTPLHTPLWIPQLIWMVGLAGFTLSILVILAGTIFNLVQKRYDIVHKLVGASTLEEEIEEETGMPLPLDPDAAGGAK
jgi:TRAP-type C4-dicarboxylate transport system permease small subunit